MKIAIIGAGASGLMAARILAEHDHDVIVLEARDRIGGRIHTIHGKFTEHIEAGAEFMHGKQPLTMALLKEANCGKSLLAGRRYQIWDGHREKGELFDDDWNQLTDALKKLQADIDLASFLDRYFSGDKFSRLRRKVRGFVEGYDAADMHRVSAMALREEWSGTDDEQQYQLKSGYGKLIDFLAEKLNESGGRVDLLSAVSEVQWSPGRVKITSSTGRMIEADKAVVSLPLGVLQKGMVQFSPALPGYTEAFEQMGFGGVVKFFFEFISPFWEKDLPQPLKKMGFVFSDAVIPTWWSRLPDDVPLLTGWLGGPSANTMSRDTHALFHHAVESLSYIFGVVPNEIESRIRNWHIVDWLVDPFCFGAYSYPTVETAGALKVVTRPQQDTLYFCGEHLYNGPAMGTVEAALRSGKEVADAIVANDR